MFHKSNLQVLVLLALGAVFGWVASRGSGLLFLRAQAADGGLLGNGTLVATNEDDDGAITKSARDFADAFNKGNAKALAAMWTEKGELREAGGPTLVGRASIEKAYSNYFKANPSTKIEVLVKSVRFPAKGLAVEEGLLRFPRGANNLTGTTAYVAVHVREGDQWKMALSSEGSAGQDRIEDLDWLLGEWTAKLPEASVTLTFSAIPTNRFTGPSRTVAG